MSAQYKTIKHKNKDDKEVEITYRVDADFKPTALSEICEEFIQNYCIANDKIEWLTEQYNSTETFTVKSTERKIKKDGKELKVGDTYEAPKSFVSIRSAFGAEFFGIKKDETPKTGRAIWEQKLKALKK